MKLQQKIDYNKDFDLSYYYGGGDLGAYCSEEETCFKLWSPCAKKVVLCFYSKETIKLTQTYEMVRKQKGVWEYVCKGNHHGQLYDFLLEFDKEKIRTQDPYAFSCGCNSLKSMVVNLKETNPPGFLQDRAPKKQPETIIYELHIKDFSYDPASKIKEEYRGKYKAFTKEAKKEEAPTCMEYLESLGITHVHLLPFFDYGYLKEEGNDPEYNWGYDPVNYNVPEGSYATNPHDGVTRIRECKEMVQSLHQKGIRVIMDVVYNHTYETDSWLERTAPGYYVRRLPDGSLANGSACGNDLAAGRAMVDQYIVDSVLYWAREYHIDGFRFDLMGLLTVELMNRIQKELDQIYGPGEKLIYGEPWRAQASPMEEGTLPALKENVALLDERIAVFSDDTRDLIKGCVFCHEKPGFVNGGRNLEEGILKAVKGWRDIQDSNKEISPKSCSQIIQYISAHDNLTLWDKLLFTLWKKEEMKDNKTEPAFLSGEDYYKVEERVLRANKLAAFIYFTCQGHLFFQAGEEFGRTKEGDENSYRSHPQLNMIRWSQVEERKELVEYYRGLIGLRKRLPGLCDKSQQAWQRITDQKIIRQGVVSFYVDNTTKQPDSNWSLLYICYNASAKEEILKCPRGNWEILADGHGTNTRKPVEQELLIIPPGSGLMIGKVRSI